MGLGLISKRLIFVGVMVSQKFENKTPSKITRYTVRRVLSITRVEFRGSTSPLIETSSRTATQLDSAVEKNGGSEEAELKKISQL